MNKVMFDLPATQAMADIDGTDISIALITPARLQALALAIALVATLVSICIAVFAGLQRAGSPLERAASVALSTLSVLCAHLLPMFWRMCSLPVRFAAVLLWAISLAVVLVGQAEFVAFAYQHAADRRADAVAMVQADLDIPAGRSATVIARDIEKTTVALARRDMRRCVDDCPAAHARRATLSAQLAALTTEADEARRRETEEDRLHAQFDRAQALRESRRADPVTSRLADWLGTTEARLTLLLAFACAVVLEGAAGLCWCLAAMPWAHVSGREAVAANHQPVALLQEAIAVQQEVAVSSRATDRADAVGDADGPGNVPDSRDVTAADAGRSKVASDDDVLLAAIHQAVMEGRLRPTQKAIREYVGRGQKEGGRLNRLYATRFGDAAAKEVAS
jgi:hypothetical protein